LDLAWKLLRIFPPENLKKINKANLEEFYERSKEELDFKEVILKVFYAYVFRSIHMRKESRVK